MNWPTDKKEQIKLLSIVGVVVVAVIGGVYFALSYISEQSAACSERVKKLEDEIKKADLEIAQMTKDRATNIEALTKSKEASDKYFLHPTLGNYGLNAQRIIEECGKKANLQDLVVKGGEFRANPPPAKAKATVRMFEARVSVSCGVYDLLLFMKELETSNPYITIQDLTLSPALDPRDGKHKITFTALIPAWITPDTPDKLQQLIQSATNVVTKAAPEKAAPHEPKKK